VFGESSDAIESFKEENSQISEENRKKGSITASDVEEDQEAYAKDSKEEAQEEALENQTNSEKNPKGEGGFKEEHQIHQKGH